MISSLAWSWVQVSSTTGSIKCIVASCLYQTDLAGKHRQRVIEKQFERYIAQKKLSSSPEDIAIALQGEALIRSYSLSSASRPTTPPLSPNLTRVNTLETLQSSPPSTPQHVATLKKSQIPEVAHSVKQYPRATSSSETRLRDTQTASESKTQSTPSTPPRDKVVEEPNPQYPWLPKMVGGSGRYRHAEDASASWIQENTIAQMENTGMAEVLWHFGTRRNLSLPDGTSLASAAALRLIRAYQSPPPKEPSEEIDEDGVHIFRGFKPSGNDSKPIFRTKSEAPVQVNQSVLDSLVMTNKVSFGHSGNVVNPFGGTALASYKAPSLSDPAHPLSQSHRAATKAQKHLALRQQMSNNYSTSENAIETDSEYSIESGSENAIESDSEDEELGEIDLGTAGQTIQPEFMAAKKPVPKPNLVRQASSIHAQRQPSDSNNGTAVQSDNENESSKKAFKGVTKTATFPAHMQKMAKSSVHPRVAVKPQAKAATGTKIVAKTKATRKTLIKKTVRFSDQLVTKTDNEVIVITAKDLVANEGSADTIASSSRSDFSVGMQSQAQQLTTGKQKRKDSTDPSSVSSGEKMAQQKKLSSKAKGKQRAIESDGNISDSSAATVICRETKVGRKRALTAIRIPKVEVAVENAEVHTQPT